MCVAGAVLLVAVWAVFAWDSALGSSLPHARTSAVNTFVAVQALFLLLCRSHRSSVHRLGTNRWLLAGIATQLAAQLALTYLPAAHALFHTDALDLQAWGRVAAVAGLVLAAHKRWSLRSAAGAEVPQVEASGMCPT